MPCPKVLNNYTLTLLYQTTKNCINSLIYVTTSMLNYYSTSSLAIIVCVHHIFIYIRISSRKFGLGWKWAWQLHAPCTVLPITIKLALWHGRVTDFNLIFSESWSDQVYCSTKTYTLSTSSPFPRSPILFLFPSFFGGGGELGVLVGKLPPTSPTGWNPVYVVYNGKFSRHKTSQILQFESHLQMLR